VSAGDKLSSPREFRAIAGTAMAGAAIDKGQSRIGFRIIGMIQIRIGGAHSKLRRRVLNWRLFGYLDERIRFQPILRSLSRLGGVSSRRGVATLAKT
jgi:hypothetical protein